MPIRLQSRPRQDCLATTMIVVLLMTATACACSGGSQPDEDESAVGAGNVQGEAWPYTDPLSLLARLQQRDAAFDNRTLEVEHRWVERISPRSLQAEQQFNDVKFGQRNQKYPDPKDLPDDYDQPHRKVHRLTVRGRETTLHTVRDLEERINPDYGILANAGFTWSNAGGVERCYSPATESLHKMGLPSETGVLRAYQHSYEWATGYGFGKLLTSIESIEKEGDNILVTGTARVFGIEKTQLKLELDRFLVGRHAVLSIFAANGGSNDYIVETTGTRIDDEGPPVAKRGHFRRVIKAPGRKEYEQDNYQVVFVSLSQPLTDDAYNEATEIRPEPKTREIDMRPLDQRTRDASKKVQKTDEPNEPAAETEQEETKCEGEDNVAAEISEAVQSFLDRMSASSRGPFGGAKPYSKDDDGNIVELRLSRKSLEAGDLAIIGNLDLLRKLDLGDTNVTDAQLADLVSLTNLKELDLFQTEITDTALLRIARLKSLERLNIGRTNVTDDGLSPLTALPRLTWLSLHDAKITDRAAETLSQIQTLESLKLGDTKFSDTGLEALTDLKNLTGVTLTESDVTQAGLDKFAQNPRFAWISSHEQTRDEFIRRMEAGEFEGVAQMQTVVGLAMPARGTYKLHRVISQQQTDKDREANRTRYRIEFEWTTERATETFYALVGIDRGTVTGHSVGIVQPERILNDEESAAKTDRIDKDAEDETVPFTPVQAKLPDGTILELLGVIRMDDEPRTAWRPNGMKMAIPESWPVVTEARDQDPTHGFMFRCRNLPEGCSLNWRLEGRWATPTVEKDVPEFLSVSSHIAIGETTILHVGVLGDWGPWQQVTTEGIIEERVDSRDLRSLYESVPSATIFPGTARILRTGVAVDGINGNAEMRDVCEYEITAIGRDGQRLNRKGVGSYLNGQMPYFSQSIEDIKHFEFRLREFEHWIKFENVALSPEVRPTVNVKLSQSPTD